jgi:hypothetical protein
MFCACTAATVTGPGKTLADADQSPLPVAHCTHIDPPVQVKTALEMESHEEKLHQMIRQSKINEAKVEIFLPTVKTPSTV